jgi:hypothetical protein
VLRLPAGPRRPFSWRLRALVRPALDRCPANVVAGRELIPGAIRIARREWRSRWIAIAALEIATRVWHVRAAPAAGQRATWTRARGKFARSLQDRAGSLCRRKRNPLVL